MTGPVARFARMIAGHGYICAAPSSYHEFTGPEPMQYNAEDTDKGNVWKVTKVRAQFAIPFFAKGVYWLSARFCSATFLFLFFRRELTFFFLN